MNCRHCAASLKLEFVDLGSSPPSNAYLTAEALKAPEQWFPLRVLVCTTCWLVQTEDFAAHDELFDADYAYFSGYSSTWDAQCKQYVDAMVDRFGLTADSMIVEVAANDGTLLKHALAAGIGCLGIEPTKATADAARAIGLDIVEEFFGEETAGRLVDRGIRADLTAANNVLAHVPDINDFVAGFARLLADDGVATFEFPHLVNLVAENQFDTIYHEHFSYLSLTTVDRIFAKNGLSVFDVEELPTHGGSLRVFAQRSDSGSHLRTTQVDALLGHEADLGVTTADYYAGFQARCEKVKNDLLTFLIAARESGKRVAGYGAAAKGNTLLNFAGVRPDLLAYVADANPAKQGKYMPGSRIPIESPEHLQQDQPDYIVILPWNLADEVRSVLAGPDGSGPVFVTAIPELAVR